METLTRQRQSSVKTKLIEPKDLYLLSEESEDLSSDEGDGKVADIEKASFTQDFTRKRSTIYESANLIQSEFSGSATFRPSIPSKLSFMDTKQGYLMKKTTASRFGVSHWVKRYVVFEHQKLKLYHSERDYQLKCTDRLTVIRLVDIQNVCFHYDKDAPVKSKKLMKQRTQA